jgi:hypothetical protein
MDTSWVLLPNIVPNQVSKEIVGRGRQLETEVDYHAIYKRAIVEQDIEQSKEEIEEGIKKAQLAYEIATNSLFRDVSGYSFANYEKELKTDVDLEALKDFTERFLQHHRRQIQKKDGLIEFLTPDVLKGVGVEERYSKVTFDRKAAIDNPDLTFFALGHPFVDRMLKVCGDVSFGGYCAVRHIESRRVKPCTGFQLHFIIRERILREDHEEFLFTFCPVFVREDGSIDEVTTRVCLESYSHTSAKEYGDKPLDAGIRPDQAFAIAKAHLQKNIQNIWDWDEDVSLLNVAFVMIGRV